MEIPAINEIIRSQENDSKELQQIYTNIRKDAPARKTQKYITDRKILLDSIYQRAVQNHKLLEEQEVLSTHKYITTDYFRNFIKKYYDAATEHLQKCEEKPQTSTSQPDELTNSPRIVRQNYRIQQLKKKISQATTAVHENKPAWRLKSLILSLEKQWQEIEDNHVELLMEQGTLELSYFEEDCFTTLQEELELTLEKIHEKIFTDTLHINNDRPSSTKLPRIIIPTFTGTYESWNSFYDLFTKIIHNDSTISTTEKMQYLKTHVTGDAAKLIRHLNVNEANYEAALKLLTNRFKDERLIMNTFLDKILDLPTITSPNAEMLRNMHDTVNESLEALKNLNVNITYCGPLLARIVSSKWDQYTKTKYEEQLEEPNKVEDFSKLMKFLEKQFKILESCEAITSNSNLTITAHSHHAQLEYNEKPALTSERRKVCWYCRDDHNIHRCPSFKTLHVNERISKVKQRGMCYICINHTNAKTCVSKNYSQCKLCNKAHDTLLHRNLSNKSQLHNKKTVVDNTKQSTPKKVSSQKLQQKGKQKVLEATSNVSFKNTDTNKTVLLATALVETTTFDGTPQLLRVLCDQGSEASFCTEKVAELLGYPRQKIHAEINGIADEKPKTSKCKIDVTLRPRFASNYKLHTSLVVMPRLTSALPKQNVQQVDKETLDNKLIADPTYYRRGPIDVILGAEYYSKLLLEGLQKLPGGTIAQNTEFGWIFWGNCHTESNKVKIFSMITRAHNVQPLTGNLEEVPRNHKSNDKYLTYSKGHTQHINRRYAINKKT